MFAAIAAAAEEPQNGSVRQEMHRSGRGNNRKGVVPCSQIKGKKATQHNTFSVLCSLIVSLHFMERDLSKSSVQSYSVSLSRELFISMLLLEVAKLSTKQ